MKPLRQSTKEIESCISEIREVENPRAERIEKISLKHGQSPEWIKTIMRYGK